VCPASVTCNLILPSSASISTMATGKPSASGGLGTSNLAGDSGVQMSAVLVAVFAMFGGLL
jgi:hypothetical protein